MQQGIVLPLRTRCNVRPVISRRPSTVKCCFIAANPGLSLSAKCPYRTLGVRYDANDEEIKGAFRTKAKLMHPDVSKDPMTIQAFMDCKVACDILLNAEARAKYDKTLPRPNGQVLSYLNACSAARHGILATRGPSRAPYIGHREIRTNLLCLLNQIKTCAKHLEREYAGKDGILRGLGAAAVARSSSTGGVGSSKHSVVVAESDCGEHECCEPWIYYATEAASEDKPATVAVSASPRRR